MGNRIGWFLILLISILAIWWFYWYFYIFNIAHVEFRSNNSEYSLELRNKQQIITQDCENKICTMSNIPPFDFTLYAKKPWYKTIEKEIKFSRKITEYSLDFQKDFELVEIEKKSVNSDKIIENFQKENELTPEEKIALKREELLKNRNLYLKIEQNNNEYRIYQKQNNSELLTIYKNDILLWNIPKVSKDIFKIYDIYWTDKNFIIQWDEKIYFFSEYTKNYQEIAFQIPILYVKQIHSTLYIFQTQKWWFTWEKDTNSFQYNHLFSDYIFYKGKYIWYISAENSSIKNRIFPEITKNWFIIYEYNPDNKEKNILVITEKKLNKIYIWWNKILLEDTENKNYYLPHFEL